MRKYLYISVVLILNGCLSNSASPDDPPVKLIIPADKDIGLGASLVWLLCLLPLSNRWVSRL